MNTSATGWVGRLLAQRYRITAELGEGGMGSVFRAHDSHLEVDVVIKVPHPFLLRTPTAAARFSQEVRSLVTLAHPHVVRVIDVGQEDGLPFVVMQHLAGGCLEDRRPRDAAGRVLPMSLEAIRPWIHDVAEALDFMHRRGYVHRDVKPANILFDEHGHVFLSDFGIAKALTSEGEATSSGLTGTGAVLGTPHYMAPELVLGKKIDGRVDQYALGVTIFELLAGSYPFDAPSPTAVLVQHTTQLPPKLTERNRQLPAHVASVVDRALSKDPQRRFETCGQFADALLGSDNTTRLKGAVAPPRRKNRGQPGKVACPCCQKTLRLLSKHRGRKLRCPACGGLLQVSAQLDELTALHEATNIKSASSTNDHGNRGSADGALMDTASLSTSGTIPLSAPPSPPVKTASASGERELQPTNLNGAVPPVAATRLKTFPNKNGPTIKKRQLHTSHLVISVGTVAAILIVAGIVLLRWLASPRSGGPTAAARSSVAQHTASPEPIGGEPPNAKKDIRRETNSNKSSWNRRATMPNPRRYSAPPSPPQYQVRPRGFSQGQPRAPTVPLSEPIASPLPNRRSIGSSNVLETASPPGQSSTQATASKQETFTPRIARREIPVRAIVLPDGERLSFARMELSRERIDQLMQAMEDDARDKEQDKEQHVYSMEADNGELIIFEHDSKFVDGIAIQLSEDGRVRFAFEMEHNALDGESRIYDETGQLTLYANYKRGKRDGWACWFEDGRPVVLQKFKYGKKAQEIGIGEADSSGTAQGKPPERDAVLKLNHAMDSLEEEAKQLKQKVVREYRRLAKERFRADGTKRAAERRERLRRWQAMDAQRRAREQKEFEDMVR